MIGNEQNFPKGTAHAVISETSGTIFSLSFKVGTMIEMEFSVILVREMFL